jgi:hypothetical protein
MAAFLRGALFMHTCTPMRCHPHCVLTRPLLLCCLMFNPQTCSPLPIPHPDARAGQGIFYSASTNTYSVRDCGMGQYGLPNATYGLDPFPCRDCPKGMTTSKTFAQSAQYYVEYSAGRGGFTDIRACVTMPGWAYRGRTAERCPAGTWAAPGSGSCTP